MSSETTIMLPSECVGRRRLRQDTGVRTAGDVEVTLERGTCWVLLWRVPARLRLCCAPILTVSWNFSASRGEHKLVGRDHILVLILRHHVDDLAAGPTCRARKVDLCHVDPAAWAVVPEVDVAYWTCRRPLRNDGFLREGGPCLVCHREG